MTKAVRLHAAALLGLLLVSSTIYVSAENHIAGPGRSGRTLSQAVITGPQDPTCQVGITRWTLTGQVAYTTAEGGQSFPFCNLDFGAVPNDCASAISTESPPSFVVPTGTSGTPSLSFVTAPDNTDTTVGLIASYENTDPARSPLFCRDHCAMNARCEYVTAFSNFCYEKSNASSFKDPTGKNPGRTSYRVVRSTPSNPTCTPTTSVETAPPNTDTTGVMITVFENTDPNRDPVYCSRKCMDLPSCAYVTAYGAFCYAKPATSAFKDPPGQNVDRTSYHIIRMECANPSTKMCAPVGTCSFTQATFIPMRYPPAIDCQLTAGPGLTYNCTGCGYYTVDAAGTATVKCFFD